MSARARNVGLLFSMKQHCAVRNGGNEGRPSTCAPSAEIDGSWPTTTTAIPDCMISTQRLDHTEVVERLAEDLRGLHGARQRRAHDRIGVDTVLAEEPREHAHRFTAIRVEPAIAIATGVVFGYRFAVAHEIDLHGVVSSGGRSSEPEPTCAAGGPCLHGGALSDRTSNARPALSSSREVSRPLVASHKWIAPSPSS